MIGICDIMLYVLIYVLLPITGVITGLLNTGCNPSVCYYIHTMQKQ